MNSESISKYFKAYEVIRTSHKSIANNPNSLQWTWIKTFAAKMDLLREFVEVPITPSSWFRCTKLNSKVGGSRFSWHRGVNGKVAIDCRAMHMSVKQFYKAICRSGIEFDTVIWEKYTDKRGGIHEWVHIQAKVVGSNRGRFCTMRKVRGKWVKRILSRAQVMAL